MPQECALVVGRLAKQDFIFTLGKWEKVRNSAKSWQTFTRYGSHRFEPISTVKTQLKYHLFERLSPTTQSKVGSPPGYGSHFLSC